ncbi:MAG: Crp/Fnr family transcriptional regulator [Rhizobiales bacterium 32-66-11]|jgi:CRP-like cAMP-binding protein|nr:MAG: Crp/Fnr family transcriptional regulator [Rhizobiales bacterium 32-66-11]
MTNPLVRRLEHYDQISSEERLLLEGITTHVVSIPAGTDAVQEGQRPGVSTLLLDGHCARYNLTEDGHRRITALHIAGDFVDLHGFILRKMDHSVGALTDCAFACVDHAVVKEITRSHPHITRLFWLSTLVDAAVHRQWLAISHASAAKRAAHLFCELLVRKRTVGLATGDSYYLPITQVDLGDALSISKVHMSRTMKELRAKGLITWEEDRLTIPDWDAISDFANFDPTYLSLSKEPR